MRESTSWVWDEEGVPEGDCVEPCEGEAVPELDSFFLEDLLSLARERTLWRKPFMAVGEMKFEAREHLGGCGEEVCGEMRRC